MERTLLTDPDGVRWVPSIRSGDGVLVLAGSSGRIDEQRARLFAEAGAIAESIRWFGGPGQHDGPWEIPVETFLRRIDSLKEECRRVFVVGTSFGSEAALLCGAYSENLDGVIAFAPSDVVWAGYDSENRLTSHWTRNDKPLPFVPFDWDGYVEEHPARFRPMYERSRKTYRDEARTAAIPVERIRSLLLVAGGDDQVWPSNVHAESIRRARLGVGRETTVIYDPEAGHRTVLPGEEAVKGGMAMQRGGTEIADERLGGAAWSAIGDFLGTSRNTRPKS